MSKGKRQRAARAAASASRAAPGRRRRRSRKALLGLLATVVVAAAAATGGLLLARNSSTRNVALPGGQKLSVPARADERGRASGSGLGLAPSFSIGTLAGETFSLRPLRGPVILSFIAGWCASCLQ